VRHLKDGIRIISRAIEEKAGDTSFEWLDQYAAGLRLLDDYDHETLDRKGKTNEPVIYPSYEEFIAMVEKMRADFLIPLFSGRSVETGLKVL